MHTHNPFSLLFLFVCPSLAYHCWTHQEAHSRITRFILICNYVTRIIEPLASRCAKFRFQPLPPAAMRDRLAAIATAENCGLDWLDPVLELSKGDMRRAVTTLQSAQTAGPVDRDALAEMAGLPPSNALEGVWERLTKNTTPNANGNQGFRGMEDAVEDLCAEGCSATGLLKALSEKLLDEPVWSELSKAKLSIRLAEVEKKLIDGADEYLQLMTVFSLALTCFQEHQDKMKQ